MHYEEPNVRFILALSRFSFGPEGDEEVYVAVDERNEALVDVEIYAC
jgi:hypothetical protein